MLPPVLYHYTTQSGLLGTLNDDAIWATKIHFLNDSSEYNLALNLANDLLQRLLIAEKNSKQREKIQTLSNNLAIIERMNVCVCSFSTNGDLLSQWRAYAGSIAGFSVGFHTKALLEKSEEQEFFLAPCIYDGKEHEYRIEQVIKESLAEEFNTIESAPHPTEPDTLVARWTDGNFAMKFSKLAAVLKNDAFKEECEWRLISNFGVHVTTMNFRTSPSTLIPYVPFRLGSSKTNYLKEIIVGPTVHASQAVEATRMLLGSSDTARFVTASSSDIPYRAR